MSQFWVFCETRVLLSQPTKTHPSVKKRNFPHLSRRLPYMGNRSNSAVLCNRSPIYGAARIKSLKLFFFCRKRGKSVGKACMGELPKLPRDWLSPCCFPRVVENKRVKNTIYGFFAWSTGEFEDLGIYRGHIWAGLIFTTAEPMRSPSLLQLNFLYQGFLECRTFPGSS